jgi:LuxR family transcriptional regulator, maltose regulon positive regulatory protein
LRAIQGDWTGMLESINQIEASKPELALYAQGLRHRWSVYDWMANKSTVEEAQRWVTQAALSFRTLPDITGVDPVSRMHFQTYLRAAQLLTRLAIQNPKADLLQDVQTYLARQERFAGTHQLVGWLIEIWLVRALIYQVEGEAEQAYNLIQAVLSASAPRGYFRSLLDEADLLCPLLASVAPRLKETVPPAFAKRLLAAMPGESGKGQAHPVGEERFSDREREVLGLLAAGLTYEAIGRQLFLSLNTVQFHVKNIYGKLLVNKRVQAIEKARALNLI